MNIISALLLEMNIILFCDDICVLTTTIMFFYSILKPFRYPFCLIFSLPNNDYFLPILDDCIIPCLLGINVKTLDIESKKRNAIYVDLNKDKINYECI